MARWWRQPVSEVWPLKPSQIAFLAGEAERIEKKRARAAKRASRRSSGPRGRR